MYQILNPKVNGIGDCFANLFIDTLQNLMHVRYINKKFMALNIISSIASQRGSFKNVDGAQWI